MSVQSYAGIGTQGVGLGNPAHQNDVLSVLGTAVFGTSALGTLMSWLLILMVLTSTAATAQTTVLPNARTTLSMSFHKALPEAFGRVHPKYGRRRCRPSCSPWPRSSSPWPSIGPRTET